MLEQKNRIKKKKDIENIFKKGKTFKQDSLILKILKNDLSFSRFGFIVPKKVSKKAVVRNKIKRRIREIVRSMMIKELKTNNDCLIIGLKGIEEKDFQETKNIVEKLFKKQAV